MSLRKATAEDIPRMMHLAAQSQSAAQWSSNQYEDLFRLVDGEPRGLAVIAVENAEGDSAAIVQNELPIGFLVARHLTPEWELENIVVSPVARRKGVGRQLLAWLLAAARETNSDAVFLEVRHSNAAARALYERAGFHQTGRRKSYYSNPVEDAILYRLGLL